MPTMWLFSERRFPRSEALLRWKFRSLSAEVTTYNSLEQKLQSFGAYTGQNGDPPGVSGASRCHICGSSPRLPRIPAAPGIKSTP